MLLLAKLTFVRPDLDLVTLYPLAVFGLLMVAALCFELRPRAADDSSAGSSRPMAMVLTSLGLLGLIASYLLRDNRVSSTSFNAMLADDGLSRWAGLLIAFCALLGVLSGQEELDRNKNRNGGEFVALILGASLGMLLMASALNTMVMFLGLELFSIALYLLCIFFPERATSRESGMKYFLLSSAASAVLLYGLALLYGATGTTWIAEMGKSGGITSPLALTGIVLVTCGLLFKLAVVPFHMWAPDVYEGAPTTVTAFMSVATKVAAICALWRLTVLGNPELADWMEYIFTGLAIVSMALGNLMALSQTSVKRMLAYSGIGNAGYLMIAPAVGVWMQVPMMFFLTTYLFANVGAFLALSVVERLLGREVERSDLRGLYRSHPALAGVFALCLVSLAGLPPAGGFLGKFFLFGRAIGADWLSLPAIGIAFSLVGAAYYLSTAVSLFDGREESVVEVEAAPTVEEEGVEPATSMTSVALAICAAGVLLLGVLPAPYMAWLIGG